MAPPPCVMITACVCAVPLLAMAWRLRAKPFALDALADLRGFTVQEVISTAAPMVLLGRFKHAPEGELALVKLRFCVPTAAEALAAALRLRLKSYSGKEFAYFDGVTAFTSLLASPNIRGTYALEIIAPASAWQIARSRKVPMQMLEETPAIYEVAARPAMEQVIAKGNSGWIYNILDLQKEQERLLHHDTDPAAGFLLNVDTKWSSHPNCLTVPRSEWAPNLASLYCLAYAVRRDLRSLRDLRGEHLPLLRNILKKGQEALKEVYGIEACRLRVFIHYPPQFYHFHVHFTALDVDFGIQVERAHLLQDVIRALETDPDHYARRTLVYKLPDTDPVLVRLQAQPVPETPEQTPQEQSNGAHP